MITYKDFFDDEACLANKLIDMYEGNQLEYLIDTLNGLSNKAYGKRENWEAAGMIPRVRNFMSGIINKSSTLFNKPPMLKIWANGVNKGFDDPTFNDLMDQADWISFFHNERRYTRLLKSTCVLQERIIPDGVTTEQGIYRYNRKRGDILKPRLLHRGNTVIVQNAAETQIIELAYLTSNDDYDDADDKNQFTYRHIDLNFITDIAVDKNKPDGFKETILLQVVNPHGIVPATMFYDEAKPRCGVWAELPEDLLSFQEMYNLWLTDVENAMKWQMVKQLFLDSDVAPANGYNVVEYNEHITTYNSVGSKQNNRPAGLGSIIRLVPSSNGTSPTFEWKGPESDLTMIYDVMSKLITDIASDWSVKLKAAGSGLASSGFQLIVEEIDNLTLRETQIIYFNDAIKHFYEVTTVLYPELTNGVLYAEFEQSSLPVNQKEQLDLWITKINAGLATKKDYLMQVEKLSEKEADLKLKENNSIKNL